MDDYVPTPIPSKYARRLAIAVASLLRFDNYAETIAKEFGWRDDLADVMRGVAREYAKTSPLISGNARKWLESHP